MINVLLLVPGILLVLSLSYWERRLLVRGVSPITPHYTPNDVGSWIVITAGCIPLLIYLLMQSGIDPDWIIGLWGCTLVCLLLFQKPADWLVERLIRL
jgi:hypothetical protein